MRRYTKLALGNLALVTLVGLGLAGTSVGGRNQLADKAQGGPSGKPTPKPSSAQKKSPLKQADFTYIGSWSPGRILGGNSTAFANGALTGRYVEGKLRFFFLTRNNHVWDLAYPGSLAKSAPWPTATVVRDFGNVTATDCAAVNAATARKGGRCWEDGGNPSSPSYMWWSASNDRLYTVAVSSYHSLGTNGPFLYANKLDDKSGASTALGYWAVKDGDRYAHYQRLRGQLVRIPQAFAKAYTGGKTLGLGHGGFCSIAQSASMGPALIATSDPAAGTKTGIPLTIGGRNTGTTLPTVTLLAYPYKTSPAEGRIYYCRRLPDYDYPQTAKEGLPRDGAMPIHNQPRPMKGIGYWTWNHFCGGQVWIDGARKHALLNIAAEPCGKIYYSAGHTVIATGGYKAAWRIYDPADLARVAKGTLRPYQVVASSYWRTSAEFGPASYVSTSQATEPDTTLAMGAWFDETTSCLHVCVSRQDRPDGSVEFFPLVHVWRVDCN